MRWNHFCLQLPLNILLLTENPEHIIQTNTEDSERHRDEVSLVGDLGIQGITLQRGVWVFTLASTYPGLATTTETETGYQIQEKNSLKQSQEALEVFKQRPRKGAAWQDGRPFTLPIFTSKTLQEKPKTSPLPALISRGQIRSPDFPQHGEGTRHLSPFSWCQWKPRGNPGLAPHMAAMES